MQKVRIHREWRLTALVFGNRNLVLLSKINQLCAAGQIPLPPRRDHLDVGVKCIASKFKTHLVIALARRPVGHSIGTNFFSNLDKALGNKRPCDRGSKQVKAFINSVRAEHREDEISHKLFAHIFYIDVFHTHKLGFGAGRLQLFALAQIGRKGHDLTAIFCLKPLENDGGVQTTRIRKDNFFGSRHHTFLLSRLPRGSAFCAAPQAQPLALLAFVVE